MTRWTSADLAKISKGKKESMLATSMRASVLIGIDPGTHTGIAIKMSGDIKLIETVTIWKALNMVKELAEYEVRHNVLVRVEDARLRTWFGNTGPEVWKGAGSINRDCAIYFKKLTGWRVRTSKHAREAAWMIL